MGKFLDKTVFVSGSSRGIGRAIALRFAKEEANVVITGKTIAPHPTLKGTIYSTAREVEEAGGKALAIAMDVRHEEEVQNAIEQAALHFGGIDILINNASTIGLTDTLHTPAKQFDLMLDINTRGTFLSSKLCFPYLLHSQNPHIINLSPPLNMQPKWFKHHAAYSISKYGMSMCTLGMSAEFSAHGIAVNSLWPSTTIATAAIEVHFPKEMLRASRKPEIVADAAFAIACRNSREFTGNFSVDEDILRQEGITNFDVYAMDLNKELCPDLFLNN